MNELLKTIHRRLFNLKCCCSAIRKDRTPEKSNGQLFHIYRILSFSLHLEINL